MIETIVIETIKAVTKTPISKKLMNRVMKGVVKFHPFEPPLPENFDGVSLYIHIPFCNGAKCAYCAFRSFRYSEGKVKSYVESVKKEISIYKQKLGDITIGDVYFGGGTPSLACEGVIEIVDYLRSNFRDIGEIGMEAHPRDVNETMCDALLNGGISKISLGVESFDEKLLRSMGRECDGNSALRSIELLLDKGFYTSIDLLHDLPGQTIPSLLDDLKKAAQTGVHQISYYPMILTPCSRWYNQVKRGQIKLPSREVEKEMFYTVYDFFLSNGYKAYDMWDFKHKVLGVKDYVTCAQPQAIGIGVSAFSKIPQTWTFYVNTYSLKEYIKAVEKGLLPIALGMSLGGKQISRIYRIMELALGVNQEELKRLSYSVMDLNIYSNGSINKEKFKKRTGVRVEKFLRRFLLPLKILGLIEENSKEIKLTRKGMYYGSLFGKNFMGGLNLGDSEKMMGMLLHDPWPQEFNF